MQDSLKIQWRKQHLKWEGDSVAWGKAFQTDEAA